MSACVAGGCALPLATVTSCRAGPPNVAYGGVFYEKEARHWEAGKNKRVTCQLCPRKCVVPAGRRGVCGVRENRDGTYHTLVWGNPCALNIDPIEKKPLFHVLPGERAFSIGTAGCNMRCKFCQNWSISQVKPERTRNYNLPPEKIVALAQRHDCKAVAFTYNEPTVFYEYMYDTAKLAKEKGLKPVVVSNGYMNPEPMKALCEVVSAIKIDLKAFRNAFYRNLTGGRLQPVLDTLRLLKKQEMWFEIVNLIIPTKNDDEDDLKAMCAWIKKELGADVPLHFSAFHPTYRLRNLPRTPKATLFDAHDIARDAGLRYVYIGNVYPVGHRGEKTLCPNCSKVVIERKGYRVTALQVKDGKCAFCETPIPGVWA